MKDVFARLASDFLSTIVFLVIYSRPTTSCWRPPSRSPARSAR